MNAVEKLPTNDSKLPSRSQQKLVLLAFMQLAAPIAAILVEILVYSHPRLDWWLTAILAQSVILGSLFVLGPKLFIWYLVAILFWVVEMATIPNLFGSREFLHLYPWEFALFAVGLCTVYCLVIQFILRMNIQSQDPKVTSSIFRFGIKHLLWLTFVTALALAVLRVTIDQATTLNLLTMLGWPVCFLPALSVLGFRNSLWAFIVAPLASLALAATAFFAFNLLQFDPQTALQISLVNSAAMIWVLISLLVLRSAGYRLDRT